MTIEKIVEYVLHTPHNTNKAILIEMLKRLIIHYGGFIPGGDGSEGGREIIYDGGMES